MTVLETWDFILLSHQVIICKQGPTVKQSFKLFIEFPNIHLATGDLNMRITQVLLNWGDSLSTKVITMHLLRPYYVPGKEETSMHFFLLSHAISTPSDFGILTSLILLKTTQVTSPVSVRTGSPTCLESTAQFLLLWGIGTWLACRNLQLSASQACH